MTDKAGGEAKYYEFGGAWIEETRDGADIIKRSFTADPRVDSKARLDSSVREFPNGSWQTTWFDADGRATVDSIES